MDEQTIHESAFRVEVGGNESGSFGDQFNIIILLYTIVKVKYIALCDARGDS